jgi:hypothetical protein
VQVLQDFKAPSKPFFQVAPKAERAGIQPIDVCWSAERDQVHINALFYYIKETKHQEQVIVTGLTDAKQAATGWFAEMAEEVVDARHD